MLTVFVESTEVQSTISVDVPEPEPIVGPDEAVDGGVEVDVGKTDRLYKLGSKPNQLKAKQNFRMRKHTHNHLLFHNLLSRLT